VGGKKKKKKKKGRSYAYETKLLGWDYIGYVDGWPVL
jgi:hypothetical protein